MRIAIVQSTVPHYRVAPFELLGAQPGVELTVYTGGKDLTGGMSGGGEHFRVAEAPIRELGWPMRLRWQPRMLEAVDPGRFDLVILPWLSRNVSLVRTIRRANRKGVPVVLWGHGYSKVGRGWRDRVRNRLAGRADGVLVYTRTVAEELVGRFGFDASRVFVAQNAMDQRPIEAARRWWESGGEELRAFQAEHGLDPEQTMIFVSRLIKSNCVEMLIEGLRRARVDRPGMKLVIVGEGPDQERLEGLATKLGQRENVVFTGAIYDEMKLAPWMLSAAMFCYPVNIGLSVMHAFGYGLPVVTGDDVEHHGPEIEGVRDGVTGRLYREGDVDDMVRQWQWLLENAGAREAMSAEALRAVRERYTVANMVQGFLDAMRVVDGVKRTVSTGALAEEEGRAQWRSEAEG